MMNLLKRFFKIFTAGNLEFSWFYSMIFICTFFINQRGFPMLSSFLVFWGAVLLTKLVSRKKRYFFVIMLFHALGYLVSSLIILASFYKPAGALFDLGWLIAVWLTPRGLVESFLLVLILAGVMVLWGCGVIFGLKPVNYKITVQRFEKSILTIFFIALLAAALHLDIPQLPLQVLVVFFWGIMAIALFKNERWELDSYTSQSFKLITLFIMGLFLSIIPVLAFCMDYLHWAADRGLAVAKAALEPISPYLLSFLKLIIQWAGYGNAADASNSQNTMNQVSSDYSALGSGPKTELISNIIWVLLTAVVIFLVVLLVTALIRILLTKRGGNIKAAPSTPSFRYIWQRFLALLKILGVQIRSLLPASRGRSLAEKVYARLISWGTFHGIEHWSSDTPYEYAARLTGQYEHFAGEINIIMDCFCRDIYSNQGLTPSEELSLQQAWQKIRRNKPILPANKQASGQE